MTIQINTADPQTRHADETFIREQVEKAVGHHAARVTRVEVHVRDLNAKRGGIDKHCTIEVRLAGLDPLAVSADAETIVAAVSDAAGKLRRKLESDLGKLSARR